MESENIVKSIENDAVVSEGLNKNSILKMFQTKSLLKRSNTSTGKIPIVKENTNKFQFNS